MCNIFIWPQLGRVRRFHKKCLACIAKKVHQYIENSFCKLLFMIELKFRIRTFNFAQKVVIISTTSILSRNTIMIIMISLVTTRWGGMAQLGPILEGGTAVSLSSRLIAIIPLAIIFIMMRIGMMRTRMMRAIMRTVMKRPISMRVNLSWVPQGRTTAPSCLNFNYVISQQTKEQTNCL